MPDQDEIIARLGKPLVDRIDPKTFRLGIVLNGTVAAGAWTAGVLDALVEALDAWELAKAADRKAGTRTVPDHNVRLDVLGGASGGGVCAALLARAASRNFPAVQDRNGNAANPFWDVWVEKLDIDAMLGVDDLAKADAPAASLLSGKAIDLAGDAILQWGINTPGVTLRATPRPWLADPFHVLVTLTNLRGVPYGIAFEASGGGAPRASWYVNHADHALFAFASANAQTAAGIRPDEWVVDRDFTAASGTWAEFAEYTKATGAFPVGFPPRRLSRPTEHYAWRAVALPGGQINGVPQPAKISLLSPAWGALPPADQPGATYVFDCVDGGACNNEPVELVRVALAGLGNTLEREGSKADAAVLVIDPFAAAPDCPAPGAPPSMFGVGLGLTGAWKDEARFATSDLLLALDTNVCSRFLLTAGRTNAKGDKVWGGNAVSGSGLGAFLGFLDRGYRVHDFLLGRKNCRDWLRSYFVLDENNPVFNDFGKQPAAKDFRPAGKAQLPIIPLVPAVQGALTQPDWPVLHPATFGLRGDIEHRLRAVADRVGEQSKVPCNDLLALLLAAWGATYARQTIATAADQQNGLA